MNLVYLGILKESKEGRKKKEKEMGPCLEELVELGRQDQTKQ